MPKNSPYDSGTPPIPEDIKYLFDKKPLLIDESAKLYETLFSRVAFALNPVDVLEWMFAKDIVDIAWDIERIRRFQAAMINNTRKKAIGEVLASVFDDGRGSPLIQKQKTALADQFINGSPEIKETLKSGMTEHGLDDSSIMAEAFGIMIPTLAVVDRMLAAAEARRDRMLREFEWRRENNSSRTRDVGIEAREDLKISGPSRRSRRRKKAGAPADANTGTTE